MKNRAVLPATIAIVSLTILLLTASTGMVWAQDTQARKGEAKLVADDVGSSLETRTMLSTAFPIRNAGGTPAADVHVARIALRGGVLSTPKDLPVALGTIGSGGEATVLATFTGKGFRSGGSYVMTVAGTYSQDGKEQKFSLEQKLQIPPPPRGSSAAKTASTPPNKVEGGKYPPQKPNFPDDTNEGHAWRVPTGKEHPSGQPPKETDTQPAPKGDPPGIDFFHNDPLGISSSTTNEPSGAAGKDVVFVTANWFAAYSTDHGATFNKLTPSSIFPNGADGGYCCDQIVVYVASIDRIVWLLQYSKATDSKGNVRNRNRLAAASPADIKSSNGTAWTYWDFTTAQVGITNGWLDYPDLTVGDNSLYMSTDQVGTGRIVYRIPLSEIQSGSTIHYRYTDPTKGSTAYGDHLSQNTGDEVFWAGHNSNSSLRVFSWKESSNSYSWTSVNINSWNNGTMSSNTPDSQDWLTKLQNFPGNAPLGATRLTQQNGKKVNQVWFAWTASSGGSYKQSHVVWVALDRDNSFNVVDQSKVWNNSYAFAYPAFASNSDGEIGMSLEYGGGTKYENHVTGFWGDFVVYVTTGSDVGITRFGDYVTIRQNSSHPKRFDAFGYGLNTSGGSTTSDTHYIVFGRP